MSWQNILEQHIASIIPNEIQLPGCSYTGLHHYVYNYIHQILFNQEYTALLNQKQIEVLLTKLVKDGFLNPSRWVLMINYFTEHYKVYIESLRTDEEYDPNIDGSYLTESEMEFNVRDLVKQIYAYTLIDEFLFNQEYSNTLNRYQIEKLLDIMIQYYL